MSTPLPRSVVLLDRALGYARDSLATVLPSRLANPTPCTDWDLRDLLAHMDDALDAFLEAAGGEIDLSPRPAEATAADLQTRLAVKACALAERWRLALREGPAVVTMGPHSLPSVLLVGTAALEITVHGWDVASSTGEPRRIPLDLAAALQPVARAVVTPADRGVRFAPPIRVMPGTPADQALLAHLGRSLDSSGRVWRIPGHDAGAAS